MIQVKNLREEHPQNPWDVRVDRANKILGNPFYLKAESERDVICEKYAQWFKAAVVSDVRVKAELDRLTDIYRTHEKLNLFCWCVPKRCHAEVICDYLQKFISPPTENHAPA
jgi:hypothetical protein